MSWRALTDGLVRPRAGVSSLTSNSRRGFKKVKLTTEMIQKAKETREKQRKGYLDTYYGKFKEEAMNRGKHSEREELEADIARRQARERAIAAARPYTKHSSIDPGEFESFRDQYTESLRDANQYGDEPIFNEESKKKAFELHQSDPHFWTPLRLATLFTVKPAAMRGYLFNLKLEAEAREAGEIFDDEIEDSLALTFGDVDLPHHFDGKPPDEIVVKKIRNPWFALITTPFTLQALRDSRTRDGRLYREASRIPMKFVEPARPKQKHLPSGVPQPTVAYRRNLRRVMWDISPHTDLYSRTIVVRETDGTHRTATWTERRLAHDYRRHIKRPDKSPFPWPDESQPDSIPVAARPPVAFSLNKEVPLDEEDSPVQIDFFKFKNPISLQELQVRYDGYEDHTYSPFYNDAGKSKV